MDQEKKALLILHQSRSSYGDVGIKLKQRGFILDISIIFECIEYIIKLIINVVVGSSKKRALIVD